MTCSGAPVKLDRTSGHGLVLLSACARLAVGDGLGVALIDDGHGHGRGEAPKGDGVGEAADLVDGQPARQLLAVVGAVVAGGVGLAIDLKASNLLHDE